MWSRIKWGFVYLFATFVILGRIGNALYHDGIFIGLVCLYPPVSFEAIGFDAMSLFEDWVVFVAVRHLLRKKEQPRLIEG
jgi:hypothetical protein